ncbi:prothymosin alpha-like, partial [Carlito syrichta]|uniref:Prothymosin alpha n=1 Tax=Carlito syrichta TaxID=1868482 RepID=A0A1U7TRU9_CARSF
DANKKIKIPTACSETPSLHCSQTALQQLERQSPGILVLCGAPCMGTPACPTMLHAAAGDTSAEITAKDFREREKKDVVEEAEHGRGAPAKGNARNAREENEEQETENEEEEEGGEEEEEEEEGDGEEDGDEDEEGEAATGKRAAEGDEDGAVDRRQKRNSSTK